MKSSAYMPVRSNQPATLPEGFHFKTDSRLKNQTTSTDFKVKDFTKSLRDALPQSNVCNNFTLCLFTKSLAPIKKKIVISIVYLYENIFRH